MHWSLSETKLCAGGETDVFTQREHWAVMFLRLNINNTLEICTHGQKTLLELRLKAGSYIPDTIFSLVTIKISFFFCCSSTYMNTVTPKIYSKVTLDRENPGWQIRLFVIFTNRCFNNSNKLFYFFLFFFLYPAAAATKSPKPASFASFSASSETGRSSFLKVSPLTAVFF